MTLDFTQIPGLDSPDTESAKIILTGDSGERKTSMKAALVALGYKLRMVDTDRGFKILRALLTDRDHYPYVSYMEKAGIVPDVSHIAIDVPVDIISVEKRKGESYEVLSPTVGRAFGDVMKILVNWNDGQRDLGSYGDWTPDTVLDFDTLSTLSELAKFYIQDMNKRLGALEDDHGRDAGDAQELIRRLAMKLTSPAVRCNVIMTTHIRRLDVSRGAPLSTEQLLRENKSPDPRGFPDIVGRALAPVFSKRWNDWFLADHEGSGRTADYRIYTVPRNNVNAKSSVWLEDSYSSHTGLGEIFCALQYKDPPIDFINHVNEFYKISPSKEGEKGSKSGFGFGR